jgi:hypothetical protein
MSARVTPKQIEASIDILWLEKVKAISPAGGAFSLKMPTKKGCPFLNTCFGPTFIFLGNVLIHPFL